MKQNDFDLSVLSSPLLTGGGLIGLIGSSGWAVAAIALFIAALVTFTEVGFVGGVNENVTGTVIVLLISSYLIYFSMESAGQRLGKQSEEYKKAHEEYKEALSPIRPEDIYQLREFCRDYAVRELIFRQEARLMRFGLTYSDYERFVEGEYRGGHLSLLRSVKRMRPKRLTPHMLLTVTDSADTELTRPEGKRLLTTLSKLLPTTVCTFFTGALVLGFKDNLTALTVAEGLVKLSALPIIAFKGYLAGYNYAVGSLSVWIGTKTKLLKSFSKTKSHAVI